MAEAVAVAASVVALIQISARVASLCRFYIESLKDSPSDLRIILLEVSALRTTFQNVEFLIAHDKEISKAVSSLAGKNGAIEGCERAMAALEALFPSDVVQTPSTNGAKKSKVKITLATLAWPFKQSRAKKLLEEISQYKATINLALTFESLQDIKHVKTEAARIHEMLTESQRHEIYAWLVRTDPSSLHNKACSQYEAGTGDWMFRLAEWKDWIDAKSRGLWIHGIPGAGKTVLMSHLIQQVRSHRNAAPDSKQAYGYYYCYFGHNQDEATPFLRWLLNQFCRQARTVTPGIYALYKRGGEPNLVELLKALEEVLDYFDVAYVMVDAVDESAPREDMLKIIRDLAVDERFKKIQLLASSREYVDIETAMGTISVPVSMANPSVQEDIRRHVGSLLKSIPDFKRWPQGLLQEVEDAVSSQAQGMFRWAVCQLDVIKRLKCDHELVNSALKNLPKTLDETYDRVFLTIPVEDRLFVYHALEWVSFHKEMKPFYNFPLEDDISSSILVQAATRSAARIDSCHLQRYYDLETLRQLCGCLIHIHPANVNPDFPQGIETVTFAHYTVREYLNSTRAHLGLRELREMSQMPLTQTLWETIVTQVLRFNPAELNRTHANWTLADFANNFNTYSAMLSIHSHRYGKFRIPEHETMRSLLIDVLDPSKPHYDTFCSVLRDDHLYPYAFWEAKWESYPDNLDNLEAIHLFNILWSTIDGGIGLILAEMFLPDKSVSQVFQRRLKLSIQTIHPCCIGPLGKHLNWGFEGTIIDVIGQSMMCGADYGSAIKFLWERGARHSDPTIALMSGIVSNREWFGCNDGYYQQFLQSGADVNSMEYQVTPLQIAVWCWQYDAVEALFEAGADPNYIGNTNGVQWEDNSYMGLFNGLHGLSPLHICTKLGCFFDVTAHIDTIGQFREARRKIEKCLLRHGAKDFCSETQKGPNDGTFASSRSSIILQRRRLKGKEALEA